MHHRILVVASIMLDVSCSGGCGGSDRAALPSGDDSAIFENDSGSSVDSNEPDAVVDTVLDDTIADGTGTDGALDSKSDATSVDGTVDTSVEPEDTAPLPCLASTCPDPDGPSGLEPCCTSSGKCGFVFGGVCGGMSPPSDGGIVVVPDVHPESPGPMVDATLSD